MEYSLATLTDQDARHHKLVAPFHPGGLARTGDEASVHRQHNAPRLSWPRSP